MLDVVAACVNSVYTVFGNCQQGTLTWGAPNSNPRTVVFSGAFCLKVLVPLSATKFDFYFSKFDFAWAAPLPKATVSPLPFAPCSSAQPLSTAPVVASAIC
jgi:hypothetical protein